MAKRIQLKVNNEIVYPKTYNDYMYIKRDSSQVITTTDVTKVLFDTLISAYGNGLTFTNNGIKIGKGIRKIRVDLTLWLEAQNGYVAWYIYKNDTLATYNISPRVDNVAGMESWRTGNAFAYLDVVEGDIINARVRFSQTHSQYNRIAGFYANSCVFGVQVIN